MLMYVTDIKPFEKRLEDKVTALFNVGMDAPAIWKYLAEEEGLCLTLR